MLQRLHHDNSEWGPFVIEVSVRPCGLPLAFDGVFWVFFTNLSGPSTLQRKFVMDQSWFESCFAGAEPCQLAVKRSELALEKTGRV